MYREAGNHRAGIVMVFSVSSVVYSFRRPNSPSAVEPSPKKKGPARGNRPGGGPLLIPEQPLQALPVPGRHIPLSNKSAARFQAKFLDTWPSSSGSSAAGGWGLRSDGNPLH